MGLALLPMAVVAFTATFMGTLYLQLSFSAYTLRCAVLFYTMLNMARTAPRCLTGCFFCLGVP